jgi:secondary thiamine-phosphate synthase enzyme
MNIVINSKSKRQVLDITDEIYKHINGFESGLALIFVKHTTAALTTADLDPGTDLDLLDTIEKMTPEIKWRHPHNPAHFPDHYWASIVGPSLCVPITNQSLVLGTWQRIILLEFDGPRDRSVELTLIKA